jgi:MFS family permease
LISPPVRKSFGIIGVFWVYAGLTLIGIVVVFIILTNKSIKKATLTEAEPEKKEGEIELSKKEKIAGFIKRFPIKDKRFMFFIFMLIPVQTLFAHNWLTLPQYFSRAFGGVVRDNFEFFVNLNPIFIFILTPMVTALTSKKNTYKMMIIGTAVMASAPFLLTFGPNEALLIAYIIVLTLGEAMWQPRFLQWVAEIAPKDMTGIYMGIGQFPWFMTKILTSLYSGYFLMKYCPENTPASAMNTEYLWLIYSMIAIITPVSLLLARSWMLKGFKTNNV